MHFDHRTDRIGDEIVTCIWGYVSLCGDSNPYQQVERLGVSSWEDDEACSDLADSAGHVVNRGPFLVSSAPLRRADR